MTTKDDPNLNRVFDKFFPLLHDLNALREELPQSNLEDLHYFLDTFDEWDQHPTARRMFEVEAAFREPSSVSDRDIIKRYMERVRECSLETFRLLAEHEDTEVLGTALRVFPWKGYEEQRQVLQEVLSGRGIGTPAKVSGQGVVMESKVFDGTVETESATVSETPGELSEESVDERKEVRSPFSPLPKDDPGPVDIEAEAIAGARADADWRRAAAGTPIIGLSGVAGSGLTADPTLRISLSAPGVREKRDESQAELQALLKALDGVHGHDVGKAHTSNTQEVPLSEEELQLLRAVVVAAIEFQTPSSVPKRILDVLKTLLLALEDAKEHIAKLSGTVDSLQGLAVRLGTAYFAFKGLLVTLGVL